jgi:hypothetical protein
MNKRFLMMITVGLVSMSACTTATLVEVEIDGASLFGIAKSAALPFTLKQGEGVTELPFGSEQDGIPISLPDTAVRPTERVQIRANVDLEVTGGLSGSLGLFIAPASAPIAVKPEYKVPTKSDCVGDISIDTTANTAEQTKVEPITIDLNISNSAIGACKTAFDLIKSGSFKLAITATGTASTDVSLKYNLERFDFILAGYPIKILF